MLPFRTCLLLGLLFAGRQLQAQHIASPGTLLSKVEFLNENRTVLPSEVGAVLRIETTLRDSVSGTVRSYYLPSGNPKASTSFADVRKFIRQGSSSEYYESGQLHSQATYEGGKCVGDFTTYYPNGTLKRRDQYSAASELTKGECFGPDGQPTAYFAYEQMPVYPDGAGNSAAVAQAVAQNVRYPSIALRNQLSGVIKVQFVVDANGRVQNVMAMEPAKNEVPKKQLMAYKALQESAMSAVRQLKPFIPGYQDGVPVVVSYTVPVTFRIQ